jgi:CRP-like cAMP-binding protein
MKLNKTELFSGISDKGCKRIEKCLHLHVMSYKKGETVCHYGSGSDRIGIVLNGRAAIWRTDFNGNESLLENLPEGAVFSESMSYARTAGDSILVRAAARSDIAYLDYETLLHCPEDCKSPCSEHQRLRQNLISILVHRSMLLSERVEVLCCHSIREKLLCFFRLRLQGKETGKLELPFTWIELAAYVGADRSAMMREIQKMNAEGLIETSKYTVRVLVTPSGAHADDTPSNDTGAKKRKSTKESAV